MQVTFKGEPLEVQGIQPNVGDKAPDAELMSRQGEVVKLSSYNEESILVVSVVPDVLTRTCELQTKRFTDELADKEVTFVTVSRNTVEEFNNWNDENNLDLMTLSDTKGEFGGRYGLNIELGGNKRLTRSVFIIDTDGVIQYKQMVPEVSEEPNYEEVLKALEKIQ